MSFSVRSEAGYDDNIGDASQPRLGSSFVALGPRIGVVREGANLGVDLDYYPYHLFYPGRQQYNGFNQELSLDVSCRFSPRMTLQVRDTFSRQPGSFQPSLSNSSVSVPEPGPLRH
jgi:hypothetical protein